MQLWIPRLQPLASHPFTVAHVETEEGNTTLLFYIRVHKGITKHLIARSLSAASLNENAAPGGHERFMLVEGFYGNVCEVSTEVTTSDMAKF